MEGLLLITSSPVPPLAAHPLLVFLLQIGVLLALALLLGRLAGRLGMPAVVGELFAGILVGPSLLGYVAPTISEWLLPAKADQFHLLDSFAQFCVILFIGMIGMQMDLTLARRRGVVAAKVSVAGLVLPLGLGIAAGFLIPASLLSPTADRTVFALFIGVAMCVSALPVIAKTLADMRLLHRNIGQLTMIAGFIDDIVGWFLLSIVSAMAITGGRGGDAARSFLYLTGFLVFAATVGRRSVRALLRLAARAPDSGATAAMIVVVLLLGASATLSMGLEAVLGAFTFGILIKASGVIDTSQIASLTTVVTSVLAPFFFATVGLRMNLTYLGRPLVAITALAILSVAIAGKFTGAYIGALVSRLDRWEALALGAGMNARGVIQIIVASVGLRLGVLNSEIYTVIVLVAVVTSLMAPPILRLSMAHIDCTAEERVREEHFLAASNSITE